MLKIATNSIFENLEQEFFKETFSALEAHYICNDLKKFSKNLSKENHSFIKEKLDSYGYKWDIYIESFGFSLSQEKFNEIDLTKNDENSNIKIIFKVHKKGSDIVIFDDFNFEKFLESIDLETVLSILNNYKAPICFIGDSYKTEHSFRKKTSTVLSNQCNFRNYAQLVFSPEFFHINDKFPVYLKKYFSKISLIYCLIYISDSSEIRENEIKLLISGSKTIKTTITFPNINEELLSHYYTIYSWIYSEKNKIEDKIALSRNILTSYLNNDSLIIDNSVFSSILSSNQIYIKGNISRYFEVRGKILDQIEQTVNDVNKSINSFVSNFQKSIFVFLSFFLSVFIFKVVNKTNLDKIFTKETTYLGLGFLGVSFLFFIASLLVIYLEKRRLNKRYKNVKTRYEDVLIKEDIKKILNEDSEFNDEVNHLDNRVFVYSALWVSTIVLFYFILCFTSEFI